MGCTEGSVYEVHFMCIVHEKLAWGVRAYWGQGLATPWYSYKLWHMVAFFVGRRVASEKYAIACTPISTWKVIYECRMLTAIQHSVQLVTLTTILINTAYSSVVGPFCPHNYVVRIYASVYVYVETVFTNQFASIISLTFILPRILLCQTELDGGLVLGYNRCFFSLKLLFCHLSSSNL